MKSFKYYISERTNPHGAFDKNPSNGYLGPDVLKRVNAIIGSNVTVKYSFVLRYIFINNILRPLV